MRKIITIASVLATVIAAPVFAQGQGKAKGQSVRAQQQTGVQVRQNRVKTDARARADVRGRADARTRARQGEVADRDHYWTRNSDGRWVRTRIADRPGHPHGCPPGLANRTPACVPPGQANRMFREGQLIPTNYRDFLRYEDIPVQYRDPRYAVPVDQRYILRDRTLYVVDPATRLVRSIIDLID